MSLIQINDLVKEYVAHFDPKTVEEMTWAPAKTIEELARLTARSLRRADTGAGRVVVYLSQLSPVLAQGALPLDVLEEQVDRYIAAKKAG